MSSRGPAGGVVWLFTAGLVACAFGCGNSKPATPNDGGADTRADGGGSDGGGGDGATDSPAGDVPGGTPQRVVILHTNDIHSHLMGIAPEVDYSPAVVNNDTTLGGMARLATAIGTARAQAGTTPVLLLDAGDFMMGTLFELLATTNPPELKFMKALGYDATTIGNHELDWTPTGLAGILQAATTTRDADGGVTPRETVPIVASNMVFNNDADGGAGDDQLKAVFDAGVIKTKLVKTVGTLKVGFFGLLGADAVQVTPQVRPLTFTPIATAAAAMVTELRNVDQVDLVIALSHSGISSAGTGEDAALATAVPGIDIIISGHTHDTLAQPKVIGKTVIVTAGSYTRNLGKLEITVTPSLTPGAQPTVAVNQYTLMSVDDTIMGDSTTQAGVDQYIAGVNTALTPAGLAYKAVVAETAADLPLPAYSEAPIGNLVTDAYRTVAAALQPGTGAPVIAVEGNGQLRGPLIKGTTGQVWFADLFRVTPIGIGPDQRPGYPLVTFWLSPKDIRSGLELGAAMELVADQYFLQVSGLKVVYDMARPPFGRVTSLKLVQGTTETTLDITNTTTCYKVVATNYVAGLLGVVSSFTQGALSVVAKDGTDNGAACGAPINPTTRFVDANGPAAGTPELKHWQAVIQYVSGFPDTTGNSVKDIPAAYATPQGRIVKQ